MKKFLNIQIPRFLILFGWLIMVAEFIASKLDTTLGQEDLNLGMIMFTLGATPVLFNHLKKMSMELFQK